MRAAYTGHETLTFSDYLDLDTGGTLTAEPGGVYDVVPAGGRDMPAVPEPWFTALEGEAPQAVADIPAGEEVPDVPAEPMGNPEAVEPGEPQQPEAGPQQ